MFKIEQETKGKLSLPISELETAVNELTFNHQFNFIETFKLVSPELLAIKAESELNIHNIDEDKKLHYSVCTFNPDEFSVLGVLLFGTSQEFYFAVPFDKVLEIDSNIASIKNTDGTIDFFVKKYITQDHLSTTNNFEISVHFPIKLIGAHWLSSNKD